MSRGVISRWNSEKGFGFIKSDDFEKEVFVHISAFPIGCLHPRVWDKVVFKAKRTPKGVSAYKVGYDIHTDREPNKSLPQNSNHDFSFSFELLQDD